MADFSPVSFTKDGITEIAYSQAEFVSYLYEGWTLGDAAPPELHGLVSTTIRRIEFVDELPPENPSPAGTLYLVATPDFATMLDLAERSEAAAATLLDTGWRNVTSLVDPFFVATGVRHCYLRRIGKRVTLRFIMDVADGASGSTSVVKTFIVLPAGFGNTHYTNLGFGQYQSYPLIITSTSTIGTVQVFCPSGLTLPNWIAGNYVTGEVSFITDDVWPASLPGTAG